MAEYLINTMNRRDNYMADLILIRHELMITLIYPYLASTAWLHFAGCRHCVSSASSHILKYFGQV